MKYRLRPHPSTPASQVHSLEVDAAVDASGTLALNYRLAFEPDAIRTPAKGRKQRLDGLWRHTCFEVFVAATGARAYREYNFSPSGCWQAYAFADYRLGGPLEHALGPELALTSVAGLIGLSARVPAADLPPPGDWRLGISAVLEDGAGALSFWALAHGPGQPDFHHPDCFVLALPHP